MPRSLPYFRIYPLVGHRVLTERFQILSIEAHCYQRVYCFNFTFALPTFIPLFFSSLLNSNPTMTLPNPSSASASAPASSDLQTLSATTRTIQQPSSSTSSPTLTIIHQLSIPLPDAPYTRLRIHLSILQTTIMLFLTTTTSMADRGVELSANEAHASDEGGSKDDTDTERNLNEQMESLGQRSRPAALAPMGSFVYAMPDVRIFDCKKAETYNSESFQFLNLSFL